MTATTTATHMIEIMMPNIDNSNQSGNNNNDNNNQCNNQQNNFSNNDNNDSIIINDDNDLDHNNDAKMMKNLFTSQVLNDLKFGEQKNDSKIYDNDNDNSIENIDNGQPDQDNETIKVLESYKDYNINNIDSHNIILTSSTLMKSSTTTASTTNNDQSMNYTIMIDDLFIRKLLHQICPQTFDETWLERFKQQYLQSFDENKCSSHEREILDQILSSNLLTNVDEIFVYWPIVRNNNRNDNDTKIRIDSTLSSSSPTWLQYRDAMTYLYHFCELLMSIEAKFQHNEQKDMCQQLAREIRSYLYWITNDKRFNICDDNLRNEESISPSSSSSLSLPVINNEINDHQSITGVDDKNNKNSYQNELFYSILQHLLRILFEILMQLKQQQQNELDVGHSNRDDLIINDHLRFFQIFSKLFERSKSLTNDQQSLYIQWMKKLNTLLMLLMKYGTNNRNQNNNNNNKINNNTHQSKNQFIENKMIASSSTLSQDHESIMLNIDSNNNNNNNNDINHENNIINANGNNNDECSAIASSSIAMIPSSNEISIGSDQQINSTTIKYFENQSNQSPTSNCFISKINPLLSVESSSIQPQQIKKLNSNFTNQSSSDCSLKMAIINNGSGSQTNTNSSTHVERNTSSSAASVSSGPSSGVGSLCDSYSRCIGNNGNTGLGMSEPNSNLLFNSNTSPASQSSLSPNKFLPVGSVSSSSASMTPSPAQFSTTSIVGNNESVVNDENTLSMIFKMNQCRLIDDIAEGMPKLITPPPSSNNNDKFKESTNNSNQFGFDFNSLNSANRNLNFQQPQQQSIDESSNFGFINNSTTNIDDIQNGTTASATNGDNNNNFFNDFNITSLFSSFDDNVSSIESGTVITDHHFTNSSPTMQNLVNQHQTASMLKPYPENDANIQLQNQCFTVTMMDGNEQHQPQQQQQQQLNRFNNVTKFPLSQSAAINKQMPMMSKYVSQQQQQILSNPSNIMNSQQQQTPPQLLHSSDISSSDQLQTQEQFCERQTLYRLIISQLLFDGHRNIACHIANAEHIKCDSFLIGPSQELHKLVTFAKAKKKEDILISKPIQMSVTNNTNNPCYSSNGRSTTNVSGGTFYDMVDSNNSSAQNSPQSMLVGRTSLQQHAASSHPLRTDDSNPYVKNIFGDPSSSSAAANTLAGFGSSFASRNGANSLTTSPSIGSHRPQSQCASASILDSYTELNSSATDLYSPTSGTLDYFSANRNSDISAASMFGKSNDLNQRLSINRANGSASVAGSNDLVLTEACLKNLNQLAKLNSGPNNAALNHPSLMFGRSVSAMAAMSPLGNGNGSTSSPVVTASNNSLSRSPLSMKSPTGQISASHTTGQGKSHLIMQIVHKFGSLGQLKSQFSSPHGFCLGMNDEIIIADTNNHRICVYEKNGVCKQMFGNPGKDEGQLWYPRKIAMIPPNFVRSNANSPYYVICDRGMERSRMQIFTRTGSFVRKIPIRYIDIVAGIAINSRGHIVVVDSVSPTIYVITIENGTLIKWHDCGNYMCEPSDVAIYDDDYYICDFKGHCVVVINSNGDFIRKIGMEGLTSFPNGIDISPIGDIFVGDSHGNKFHVVVFNRDGRLLAEYECPYCKVSRCCGLKLTKDNNIVTLAKNNHHVLVLNPNFHQQQIQQQQQQQQQQQSPSQPQST